MSDAPIMGSYKCATSAPCQYVAVLDAEVRAYKEFSDKALVIAARLIKEKMEELNELRKEYTKDRTDDRGMLVTKTVHDMFAEWTKNDQKEIRKMIENIYNRITVLETEKASFALSTRNVENKERHTTVVWVMLVALFFTLVQTALKFVGK